MSINEILQQAETRMQEEVTRFRLALSSIRTGKAEPSLLDGVTVNAYGSPVPLRQVANITVPVSHTLAVTPFDKGMLRDIEQGINAADLGVVPNSDGEVVRISIPLLTPEAREELIRAAGQEAVKARDGVTAHRREAMNAIQRMQGDLDVSSAEAQAGQDQVTDLRDRIVGNIDQLLAAKERDLNAI